MLITIYDRAGNPKAELSPNDSSTQVKEVQGDNVLTLSFTLYDHIALDVYDYADFEGERYWLTERYRPKQKSTGEWAYDLKLYGIESLIKNWLVLKTVDNEQDPLFTLTAPPRDHVAMIVKCMNDACDNITDWKVGQVNGTENITIDYFGKYCDEGLREIAEKVGAEFWTEGQTVNICRCEHGEPVTLGYDKGLLSIDPGTANNVKFYTRLFPKGSSRNIDPSKYGYSRLQLPDGQKYIEVYSDEYGIVDHYEESAFADIYPRRTGTVSSIRSEVKRGEDGKDFTIYYFRDNSLPFDPNDYMIGGKVIRVSFQEGSELAGQGDEENGTYYFEVNFDSKTREFEIITIWPYDNDMQLPGDKLIPKPGDKYILWNLRMPDEYYSLAEEELLTAVNAFNSEHTLDIAVFKAPTDHAWIEENAVRLSIGQRVRLESDKYFPGTGYRDSRITRITRKVNLPSCMDLEISDALSRSAMQKVSDSIGETKRYVQSIADSISLPDIIRTGDKTRPTDNNLLSALRVIKDFISKQKDDRTAHKLSSDKAFEVGEYAAGVSGGMLGIDAAGESFAEVGRLWVRVRAYFEELTVIKAGVLAGKQYITPGGGIKCVKVEETPTAWRCWFVSEQDGEKTECKFTVGDQAIAEEFNVRAGTAGKTGNRRYWRLVVAVNNDARTDGNGNHYGYIDLSKTDCEPGSDTPKAGDEICQLGYRGTANPQRQTAMVFSTVDADAPSIKLFSGVNSFSLAGKAVVSFGCDPGTGQVFFRLGTSGAKQYLEYTQDVGLTVAGRISSLSTVDDGGVNDRVLKDVLEDKVVDTDVLFISHGSADDAPVLPVTDTNGIITDAKGWVTDAPDSVAGRYIWQVTYVRHGDGRAEFKGLACIPGQKSVAQTSETVEYAVSAQGDTPPSSGWQTSFPSAQKGQFRWKRVTTAYSDGSSTVAYSAEYIPLDGPKGDTGASYSNNLLLNPDFRKGLFKWGSETSFRKIDNTHTLDGRSSVLLDVRNLTGPSWYGISQTLPSSPGDVFTASIWSYCENLSTIDGAAAIELWAYNGTTRLTKVAASIKPTKAGQWKRAVVTHTMPAGTDAVNVYAWVQRNGKIWLSSPKLEVGTNPDPVWTPNAEGATISSESVKYAKNTTGDQPADAYFTADSIGGLGTITGGDYIWSKKEVTYTDGTVTKEYAVSRIGADGETSIAGLHVAYCSGITGSLPNPIAVTDFRKKMFAGAKYIGICKDDKADDPDDHTEYDWARFVGEDATPAKLVKVNADAQVFQYENGFATLLSPQKITLSATVQGIANPTYQWSYRQADQTGFTDITAAYGRQPTLEVNPNGECMGNAESSTVRCTVNGTVHDEVTIVRVSSGSDGAEGAGYTENLLLGSGTAVTNSLYPTQSYRFSAPPVEGKTYTCTLWGRKGPNPARGFAVFNSNGYVVLADMKEVEEGVYRATFKWKVSHPTHPADNTHLRVYETPHDAGACGPTTIDRIKLEEGDNPKPVWTPAPSDSDAYTVILTNESHIFEGDTEKAVDGHTDCGVIVYKGNRQVAATIGAISGTVAGKLTVDSIVNPTATAQGSFRVSVTTALKQKQGTLNVPVTVDGRTFTKVFSWSLSLQGKARSIAVKSYGYYYTFTGGNGYVKVDGKDVFDPAPSKRGINMVTLNRQTLAKTGQFNYDLYTGNTNVAQARTNFINKINSLDDSVFVCLLFADNVTWTPEIVTAMKKLGSLGDIRTDGASRTFAFIGHKGLAPGYALQAQGENAHTPPVEVSAYVAEGMFTTSRTQAGIKEIKEEYYLSTSRETATGDYWRTSAPVWQPDRYIWTRSHVYYTDGTDATYGEVCSTGAPGFSYAANMLGGAGRQLGPNTAYQLGAYGYAEAPVPGKTYTLTVCYKVGAKDTSIAVFVDNKGYYKIKGLTARVETVEAFRFTCPTPSNSSSPKLDRLAFFHQPNDGDYDGTNTYVKWAVLVEGDNPARAWVPSAAEMAAGVNELRNATFANGSDYWAMSSKSRVDTTPGFAGAGINSAVWEVSGDTSRHWRGISQGTFSNGKPAVRVGGVDITIPTSPGDVWTASVHTLCPNFEKVTDPEGTVALENRAMCEIQFYNASGAKIKTVQYSIMPTEQGKWQRRHLTVVAPDGAAYVGLYHWLLANGTLYMAKPMLSRGATLGDWTPSPLDTSYLQQALQNDASLEGGLVLATHIQLGYKTESGQYKVMSGLNGIYNSDAHGGGPAFWGGGKLQSAAEYPDDPDSAATMIFHDGTAYFSRNVIRMLLDSIMVGDYIKLHANGLSLLGADGRERLQITNRAVGSDIAKKETITLNAALPTAASVRFETYLEKYRLTLPNADGLIEIQLKESYRRYPASGTSVPWSAKANINGQIKAGDSVSLSISARLPGEKRDGKWVGLSAKMQLEIGYMSGASEVIIVSVPLRFAAADSSGTHKADHHALFDAPATATYFIRATIANDTPVLSPPYYEIIKQPGYDTKQLACKATGAADRTFADRTLLGNDGFLSVWDDTGVLLRGGKILFKTANCKVDISNTACKLSYGVNDYTAFEVGSSGIRYRVSGGAWKNLT